MECFRVFACVELTEFVGDYHLLALWVLAQARVGPDEVDDT